MKLELGIRDMLHDDEPGQPRVLQIVLVDTDNLLDIRDVLTLTGEEGRKFVDLLDKVLKRYGL